MFCWNQENVSLKYKAGLLPHRAGSRMSEYQKQFVWKKDNSSPSLIAAGQVTLIINNVMILCIVYSHRLALVPVFSHVFFCFF